MIEQCSITNCESEEFKCGLCNDHFRAVIEEANGNGQADPKADEPHPLRSALYVFNRIADNMIEGYRSAFRLEREDVLKIHLQEARSRIRSGSVERAADAMKRAKGISSIDRTADMELGEAYLQKGDHQQALDIFLALDGEDPPGGLILGIAKALSGLGRHAEAVSYLEKEVERERGEPEFHYLLGTSLEAMGRYDDAAESFELATALDDREPRYLQALGFVHEARGEHAHALSCFRRALDLQR